MATSLLVKNIANSYSTGDIVGVYDGDHVFGKYESKTNFINSGFNPEEWTRQFVIVNIVDAEKEEYAYLLDSNANDERRYYISPQDESSPFCQQLIDVAEITINKQTLDLLIIDRGE